LLQGPNSEHAGILHKPVFGRRGLDVAGTLLKSQFWWYFTSRGTR